MNLDETMACAACGYDLTGVGGEGRCPECGGFYDKHSGRGIGTGAGFGDACARGDRVVAQVKVAVYGVLGVGCLAWGGLASLSSASPAWPLILGVLFAGGFGFAAYVTWFGDRR